MHEHHTERRLPLCNVTLRDARPADVAVLFAFECDPAWGALAMVKPRSRQAFEAVWEKILQNRAAGAMVPGVVQKVIVADDELCGTIGCRLADGLHMVGYGLGRAHWGRGIASRALALLLADPEVLGVRPLHARVAANNTASIRVLEKNGFVIQGTHASPETERNLACDEVRMLLV
jgi:RimJ/RimL family protein N-acetyltransferase